MTIGDAVILRGGVYKARLDPTEGSEIQGSRPVVVVSRNSINQNSPVVVIVPLTDARNKARIYPSQTQITKGDGGLEIDSVALGEQIRVIKKSRLTEFKGTLSEQTMSLISSALKITLDLP